MDINHTFILLYTIYIYMYIVYIGITDFLWLRSSPSQSLDLGSACLGLLRCQSQQAAVMTAIAASWPWHTITEVQAGESLANWQVDASSNCKKLD